MNWVRANYCSCAIETPELEAFAASKMSSSVTRAGTETPPVGFARDKVGMTCPYPMAGP